MCATQPLVCADAAVHHGDHALFTIQALVCGQPVAGMNDGSLGFFDFQRAAQLAEIDPSTTVSQSFG